MAAKKKAKRGSGARAKAKPAEAEKPAKKPTGRPPIDTSLTPGEMKKALAGKGNKEKTRVTAALVGHHKRLMEQLGLYGGSGTGPAPTTDDL